jgi:hypothetical protein
MRTLARAISGVLIVVFLVGSIAPVGIFANDDPNCVATSNTNGNWYATFQNSGFADSTVAGGHSRFRKTQISLAASNYRALYVNWVVQRYAGLDTIWAEIGYGYNPFGNQGGPVWYFFAERTQTSYDFLYPLFNVDPTQDNSAHDVTIKWTAVNGVYRGYVDNVEKMVVTGLGDWGLNGQSAGLESSSCRNAMWSNTFDTMTTQSWSTLLWSPWTAALNPPYVNSPAIASWRTYPTSGDVAEAP